MELNSMDNWTMSRELNILDLTLSSPPEEPRLEPLTPGPNMLNSPEQRSPCTRGKTMREFEEELNHLKKENFDLKMRLYVLSEHMVLMQKFDNIDEIHENSIASLKAELADKEDLIVKAGDAMNLLNNKHKEEIAFLKMKAQAEVEQYEDTISRLKQENLISKPNNPYEDSWAMAEFAFNVKDNGAASSAAQVATLENQMYSMENELQTRCERLKEAEFRISELQDELELMKSREKPLREENEEIFLKLNSLSNELGEKESLISKLDQKISSLEKELESRDTRIKELSEKFDQISISEQLFVNQKLKLDDAKEENHRLRQEENNDCESCKEKHLLENRVHGLEAELEEKLQSLEESRAEYTKSLTIIQGFYKANKAMSKDNDALQMENNNLKKQLLDLNLNTSVDLRSEIPDEVCQGCQKLKQLEDICGSVEEMIQKLEDKELKIKELESVDLEKMDCIKELENNIESLESKLKQGSQKDEKMEAEKTNLESELELKNKTIDQLNEELRKRTFNLQELVNKELWDKNREIEKLNKLKEKKECEVNDLRFKMESQKEELLKLNDKIQELSDSINCKLTKKDINLLKENLEKERNKNIFLTQKCSELEKEIFKSEKSRKEIVNACLLLQNRLEELMFFMESLVPSLGGKNKKIIQDALERSKEASRTLSLSVLEESTLGVIPIPILPDFSEVDFCVDTFDSRTLEKNEPKIIENVDLNKSILEDVSEGPLPDFPPSDSSIGKSKTVQIIKTPDDHSDSDEWSEPDRNVSRARIGIPEEAVKKPPIHHLTDTSSNSQSYTSSKRRYGPGEIRKLNSKIKMLGNVIEILKKSPSKSPTAEIGSQQENKIFEKLVEGKAQIDETLRRGDCLFQQIESFKLNEESKSEFHGQLLKIIENVKNFYILCQDFEAFVIKSDSEIKDNSLKLLETDNKVVELNNTISKLQSELKEKENDILEKQCAYLELKNEFIVMETREKSVEGRLADANVKLQEYLMNAEKEKQIIKEKYNHEVSKLQGKLKKEAEDYQKENEHLKNLLEEANKAIQEFNNSRIKVEEDYKNRLEALVKNTKAKIEEETAKRLENERKLVISYEIQANLRNQVENSVDSAEKFLNKYLTHLEQKLDSWWRKKYSDLETTSLERESDLRRHLDSAILGTSQAVLERTKLANDKIRLQCELRRRNDTFHEEKSTLEQKVIILEQENAELKKKFSRLMKPPSEPGSPTRGFGSRSNANSDYQSDPDQQVTNNFWLRCTRNNNNCSPDLGIESDQGRLSSLDQIPSPKSRGNEEKLKIEIQQLQDKLKKTEQALREALDCKMATYDKKKQMDKAFLKEIHKTHQVLKKVKVNLAGPERQNQPE